MARLTIFVLGAALSPTSVRAQAHYYNLDGGRPDRIEDAEPTARYSLDLDLAPLGVERFTGGTTRFRVEPKASYGILPFTDVEIRIPFVRIAPPAASGALAVSGAAGMALGAMHAFNLETSDVPQVAVGAEMALPVGALAPSRTSYLAKLLVTKTTRLVRLHFNAGAGTYAIKTAGAPSDTGCTAGALAVHQIARNGEGCSDIPIIVDTPCSLEPTGTGQAWRASAMCDAAPPPPSSASTTGAVPATFGRHWFAGAGFDRALPLSSMLITGDVFAEQFEKLYRKVDWTAELGVRREVTPSLVLDTGAGWHFAGVVRSVSLVFGAIYELATPPLIGR